MYLLSINALIVIPITAQRPPFIDISTHVLKRRNAACREDSPAFSKGISRSVNMPHTRMSPMNIIR